MSKGHKRVRVKSMAGAKALACAVLDQAIRDARTKGIEASGLRREATAFLRGYSDAWLQFLDISDPEWKRLVEALHDNL